MDFKELGDAFRALSHPERLRMVQMLSRRGEITVTELTDGLRLSQPLVSWHLRKMRITRLILTRRVGGQVLCSLNQVKIDECMRAFADLRGKRVLAGE